MLVWRICKRRHAPNAFNRRGAEKYGGRWNHKGERIVYSSTSLSLAALELFVYIQPDAIPDDLLAVSASIADSASREVVSLADLSKNWRDYPAPASLRDFGSAWLRETRSLLLVVTSAVNPEEKNVLINPLHAEIAALGKITSRPFEFDPRMWKSSPISRQSKA